MKNEKNTWLDGYQFVCCFVAILCGRKEYGRLSYDCWYGEDKQNKKALENVMIRCMVAISVL